MSLVRKFSSLLSISISIYLLLHEQARAYNHALTLHSDQLKFSCQILFFGFTCISSQFCKGQKDILIISYLVLLSIPFLMFSHWQFHRFLLLPSIILYPTGMKLMRKCCKFCLKWCYEGIVSSFCMSLPQVQCEGSAVRLPSTLRGTALSHTTTNMPPDTFFLTVVPTNFLQNDKLYFFSLL